MPNFSESTVFNGKDWKNYDVVDGPIGERIFDIEICPKDGDVWMATSAGLTRFRLSHDWEHYTREDGLLEDQASSLAFKKDGTLIVGTQCHGLAIFARDADGHYTHERNIVAPERFGQDNCSPVPLTSTGKGLPSNLINDIIVAQNSASQTIWIATSAGLVKADNDLKNLEYQRGRDYAAKVHGLYGGAPKNFKAAPEALMKRLIPEDYLTALVEDGVGQIYVGMRQNGFLISDPVSGRRWFGTQKESGLTDNFVTKILILDDGNFLVGTYGGGVVKSTKPFNLTIRQPKKSDDLQRPNIVAQNEETRRDLPIEIKPPTIEDLKWMQKKLATLTKPLPKTHASYYGEDWKTQGDWVGNYGRLYALMCGASSPFDQTFFVDESDVSVRPFIGANKRQGDSLRRWVHWLKSEDRRVMYSPLNGYRRQAEWDDHAETYPLSHNGPSLWYLIDVKTAGVYKLSMYFFNKDGHDGNNRWRDFLIEIYPATSSLSSLSKSFDAEQLGKIAEAQTKQAPLSRTRVCDFWGGVHKSFEVVGERKYFVRVANNFSFCTIMSSVCVDKISETDSYNDKIRHPLTQNILYQPQPIPINISNGKYRAAANIWQSIIDHNKNLGMSDNRRKMQVRILQTTKSKESPVAQTLHQYFARHLNQWEQEQKNFWNYFIQESRNIIEHNEPELIKFQEESLKNPNQNRWQNWTR